jgi:uncharacterized protein YegL
MTVEETFPVANPDRPQAACALVLDTSKSMQGERMEALARGLTAYRDFLAGDTEARQIVETSIITFGDQAQVVHPFSNVEEMPNLELTAAGATSMGAAIDLGIQTIEGRKKYYKEQGVDYYRPFLVVITDGAPTDIHPGNIAQYRAKLQEGAKQKKFHTLFFGTEGADFRKLKDLLGDGGHVAGIDGARFEEFFKWLSTSLSEIKDSKPGEEVHFEDPTQKTPENPNPFAFEV